ncbi:Sec6-domain-containing protein [Yamadazyma tenuis ATCC 10573]|uniref:Sec6-domain-containing protein n=1 Tax=Candida tenuis (strain ATCC 10573 / BCRC 21748 / CBS 615 / JCM 9827 / NBRC 10315 / NRRL Y-1498 / VKM Y-70) TaxID=590646 RepID=G3AVZ9_CANTC|nr:Sec6-domain-containing protein [Yamadazyma tenuis ATCC 10573]EGV66416.1 Sec6-domain-containing protein [Yamadazyma tenuis ATCC 10573]
MSEAALSRIANLISLEDDLVKIDSLRQQFVKEKSSIDIKLNSATQSQIDSITSNLNKLNKSSIKLNNIKAEIKKINSLYDESITNLSEYDIIEKMTKVNQFFTQVRNLYSDISHFKRNLDNINDLIDAEYEVITEDITYPLNYIFKIHYNLTQARNLQDYLEVESSGLSDDLKSIIFKIIQPIKKTIKKFDDLLAEVIISVTEAVKEGNNELVFKLIQIIEFESTEDLNLILKNNLDLNSNILNINYGKVRLQKRNYKKFFYDKLEDSLIETFDKCIEHFSADKMLVYDNLNWLEDELVFVNDTLSQVFPKSWELDNFMQNVYYNKLHNFTMDIIKTDPPAEDLLRILAYDNHYNKFLNKRKSVIKPQQKSIIGEDLKNVVLDDYLKVIVSKMEEWNLNLMQSETKTFKERAQPPDLYNYHQVIEDEDANDEPVVLDIESSVYVLPDFKTPLTMLKEQADVAAESGYGKILVGVIEHWSKCYLQRIMNYQAIIDEEYDNYMSIYNNERFLIKESKASRIFRGTKKRPVVNLDEMSQEELSNISKEGLLEYLAALGNTFEINTDRLQDRFLPIYKDKVHTTYQSSIEQSFSDTMDPSTNLHVQVIRTIVEIIVNDLYPALSIVFTKKWYEGGNNNHLVEDESMASRIVETIGEYMEELRGYTTYDIYSLTFTILLDTFIAAYIRIGYENILHGEGKKIDPSAVKKFKSFSEGVGRDVMAFYGGLEHLFTRKDARYLLTSLRAIEFLGDLGTCDNPMEFIPQMWENEILGSFYNCSVEYVRGICQCRKDMDKNEINLLVNQLVKTQKSYHDQVEPPASTQVVRTLDDFRYS